MSATKLSTRFMIISDTHDFEFGQAEKVDGLLKLPTPKLDVLLHCGDLTHAGGLSSYKKLLQMLGKIDAELKLVIAGNLDLDLDRKHWESMLGTADEEGRAQHHKAVDIMTGPLAKEAGITIYTSPYQPEFCNWAFPYERDEDRFNPPEHVAPNVQSIAQNIVPEFPGVDIMMTHGPPRDILDWTAHGNVGCEALLRAASRARPLLYCFGHIHEAHGSNIVTWKDDMKMIGAEAIESESREPNGFPDPAHWPVKFGKQTLMINAAIMNLSYQPTNAPWLVDLDLPKAD
ncbi:hypothetical protein QTJ16_003330 [Diplocarpon rosae]|uniref:Calcineurin-like phosphoesterase domain-containing protein n=1 Tax=Diplocarpon rosae TaxID=946125 RepID=A0AAD9WFS5_9HELO|nr:hypothetical protein QTJ16_003330 [Diplocarpon rosae]